MAGFLSLLPPQIMDESWRKNLDGIPISKITPLNFFQVFWPLHNDALWSFRRCDRYYLRAGFVCHTTWFHIPWNLALSYLVSSVSEKFESGHIFNLKYISTLCHDPMWRASRLPWSAHSRPTFFSFASWQLQTGIGSLACSNSCISEDHAGSLHLPF